MSTVEETLEGDAPKSKGKGLLFGLLAAVLFGAGGFYAAYAGLIHIGGDTESTADHSEAEAQGGHGAANSSTATLDIAFVPLDSLVISLANSAHSKHLLFTAELEVEKGAVDEVTALMPRIMDVLNGYLRAVKVEDIEEPTSLIRLRAHMLRRVRAVTGGGRVRDLLVTEFVLN